MEGEITVMEALWTAVTTGITNMMGAFSTVSTSLLGNEIFQLMFAIVVLGICMGYVYTLVRKTKRKGN